MDRGTDSRASPLTTTGGRFQFELADEQDEAGLRALVRETPLGGAIETTLRREPNYLDGAAVEGPFHQVLAALDGATGSIVGMATRSVRMRYVDGKPTPVGYLGGLRLRPEVRNGVILARGFRALRQLHDDGRTDFYLTTVTEGNHAAIESLTRRRGGLPDYHELGRYLTFVLPKWSWNVPRNPPDLQILPLRSSEMPQWLAFLNNQGKGRLFFPCLTLEDFQGDSPVYRQLIPEQIVCAWRDGRLVGTLGAWDQSAFKQTFVERYHGHWRWSRRIYNSLAGLAALPRFPDPGQRLHSVLLALPVVADNDPVVWHALLATVRRLTVVAASECLAVGLFERDPLVELVRRSAVHCYRTRLFVVSWDPDRLHPEQFNDRNLYLELGCL